MKKDCEKSAIRSLLDLPIPEPEISTVSVPRLGLEIVLRELPYDKVAGLRGTEDADINYLLASIQAPDAKDPLWYREKMKCPTPVDALKELLRPGEIQGLVRRCDILNGYGPGSVVAVERPADDLQDEAISAALEDLEKN